MTMVRIYMQSGAYRRALTFAAHTAGAHRDTPAGAVLYAWLLYAGGQADFAYRVLDRTELRSPGDPLTAEARARLRSSTPIADGVLLRPPWRLAPYDAGEPLPDGVRVSGTGFLLDGGRRALAPAASLDGARRIWLRDGLGRRRAAGLERRADGIGVALLRIEEPLPSVPDRMAAPRDPFTGSPAFTVGYTASPGVTPAWPLLRIGFVGAPDGSGQLAGLNVAPAISDDGSPVFDNAGRLTAIVTSGSDRRTRLLPVSALRRALGELLGAPGDTSDTGSPRIAIDELYERALPVTLQVIVGP